MYSPDHIKPATRPPKIRKGISCSFKRWASGANKTVRETVKEVNVVSYKTGSINNRNFALDFVGHPRLGNYTVHKFITHSRENGHRHIVTIFSPDAKLTPKSDVIVDCECPYHTFYQEYANWRIGASALYRSNGDTPDFTNPSLRHGPCKHGYAVARYFAGK